MKEFFEYFKSVGVSLIQTPKGVIVNSSDLDKVELTKINELVPEGFFVNPNVYPSAEVIQRCQDNKQPIPQATIGVFLGKPKTSDEEHMSSLLG